MNPIKLSAVILTFNEERNIERCIRSVMDIADEVIVVDSLSTDRTQEIAVGLGAKIIEQSFLGYKEQKNFALNHASFNHVLSLDADEALDDVLRKAIIQVKNDFKADGYSMNRLTNYCGKWIYHCGWYPDKKIRLFNREKAIWKGRNPHDRLELEKGSSLVHLKGNILHYSFYSITEHKAQIQNFIEISAKARLEEGSRTNWLQVLVSPTAKFIKSYVLKLGILDGYYGFIICSLSAYASYRKYRLLLTLQNQAR